MLLDTNAVIWLMAGHKRARPLKGTGRLYLSPVSLLELKFLLEVGRLQLAPRQTLQGVASDPRWQLDNLASEALFSSALGVSWTRDPFDRLLVAHAKYRRWLLATGDKQIQAQLPSGDVFSL